MSPGQAATSQWGGGFHAVRVGIDLVDLFRPRTVGVVWMWKYILSADETLSSLGSHGTSVLAEGELFPRARAMRQKLVSEVGVSGIREYRLGGSPFRDGAVGVVELWKYFFYGHKALSSPIAAGPRHWSDEQLSPRAGSMSPGESASSQWGCLLYTSPSPRD